MNTHVLITGGGGFIGSHLAHELLNAGYQVRVLDNLSPQVHSRDCIRPAYLDQDVELIVGDVRNPLAVKHALAGIDAVFHFAAAVGVGQSMYEIEHYTSTNTLGTAVLLEQLIDHPVQRLIVASSMSIYGEGLYRDPDGQMHEGRIRPREQLESNDWDVRDERGRTLQPVPTPETKTPTLASVYALSKYDQENLCLIFGCAYKIPTVALRFFNVYGPHQALSNPYTGVLAIFAAQLINGSTPSIFEDGEQLRDFVSVRDVARACRLALERDTAAGHVINIGSGHAYSIREIAELAATALGREHIKPSITGQYRMGDIRHCFADIALAEELLGYRPAVDLQVGLVELAGWLESQTAIERKADATAELAARGLLV